MPEVSIDDQIACIERELGFRERIYPRWINAAKPKLTPKTAELELSRMRAVLATLKKVKLDHEVPAP